MADLIIAKHRNGPDRGDEAGLPRPLPQVRRLRRAGSEPGSSSRPARGRRSWTWPTTTSPRGLSSMPRPVRLAHASRLPRAGLPARRLRRLRLDPRARGRRAALRVPRAAHGAAAGAGVASVIPPQLPGRLLRPPAGLRHGARSEAGAGVKAVKGYVEEIDDRLDDGEGLWLMGDTGTGKTTLAMLVSKAALEAGRTRSRSTRCRSCWRASAAPTTPSRASESYLAFFERLTRSTCSTSTTSAPRSAATGCSSSSTRSSTSAMRAQRSVLVTTNLDQAALEEQIGPRTVSRLVEICGDPLPLFGDDMPLRRLNTSSSANRRACTPQSSADARNGHSRRPVGR